MVISQDEIFGTVISIIKYSKINESVRIANRTSKSLAEAVCIFFKYSTIRTHPFSERR